MIALRIGIDALQWLSIYECYKQVKKKFSVKENNMQRRQHNITVQQDEMRTSRFEGVIVLKKQAIISNTRTNGLSKVNYICFDNTEKKL